MIEVGHMITDDIHIKFELDMDKIVKATSLPIEFLGYNEKIKTYREQLKERIICESKHLINTSGK